MAFDYKKEYKEFYMPKNKPGIIEIPKMNYIAVRGKGNPTMISRRNWSGITIWSCLPCKCCIPGRRSL